MGVLVARAGGALRGLLARAGRRRCRSCPSSTPTSPPGSAQWLQGDVLERQLAYWREQLDGPRRPRAARRTGRARRCRASPGRGASVPCPRASLDRVRALGQRGGRDALHDAARRLRGAALALHRPGRRRRRHPDIATARAREIEGLIGFFVNTLVLRTDLSGDPTRPRAAAPGAGGGARRLRPPGPAVRAAGRRSCSPSATSAASPLFQVVFVLQNAPGRKCGFPGLTVTARGASTTATAKFDLTLSIGEAEPGGIAFEYNTDLFDAATIERMVGHFRGAAARRRWPTPEPAPLGAAPADAGEETRLLVGLERDRPRLPASGACLHELFEAQVERTPGRRRARLRGRAPHLPRARTAAPTSSRTTCAALGVGPEVRVGVCLERSLEMVVGAARHPQGRRRLRAARPDAIPRERLAFMLEDAGVAGAADAGRAWRPRLPAHGARVVRRGRAMRRRSREQPDGRSRRRGRAGQPRLRHLHLGLDGPAEGRDERAPRRSCNRLLLDAGGRTGCGDDDRVLQKTPFSFDVSVWEFFWPLHGRGARWCVAQPGRAPGRRVPGAS